MIEGRPFLYQAKGGTIYHVAEKGVEDVGSWSPKQPIVAFVDGDGGIAPKDNISYSSVQLIMASSPKGTYPKWANQLGPGSCVTQLAMKLWSPKELLLTGLVLTLLLSTLD